MQSFKAEGPIAAVITPMRGDSINYDMVPEQAKQLAHTGVHFAFICGTTGEVMSLSLEERMKLAETWKNAGDSHGCSVIVNIGTSTPCDSVTLAKHAEKIGVYAIAAFLPFYHKPNTISSAIQILEMYSKAAPKLPLLYYHYPAITNIMIDPCELFEQAVSEGMTVMMLECI